MKHILILFAIVPVLSGAAQEIERSTNILQETDRLIGSYHFDHALALLQKSPDTMDVELIQRKGYCYYRLGDYGNAISQFEQVIGIDSGLSCMGGSLYSGKISRPDKPAGL